MYETGTYSSGSDLWDKFRTFAAAAGWTVGAATPGYVFSKGAVFCGIHFDSTLFNFRGCLSYNGALSYDAQPNNAGMTHQCDVTGAGVAYHFYSTNEGGKELLAAIIEKSAGVFRHWMVCDLIKYGSWTGGTYTDSVRWTGASGSNGANNPNNTASRVICDTVTNSLNNAHAWIDYDGATDNWARLNGVGSFTVNQLMGSTRTGSMNNQNVFLRAPRWNERIVGQPLTLYANRTGSLRSPIGRVPNMRWVNVTDFSPGVLVVIGADTWQLFPMVAYTTSFGNNNTTPSTAYFGYMYKR